MSNGIQNVLTQSLDWHDVVSQNFKDNDKRKRGQKR